MLRGRQRARRRHAVDIAWVVAAAERLPFADPSFDAVHAERLLHRLPEPGRAVDDPVTNLLVEASRGRHGQWDPRHVCRWVEDRGLVERGRVTLTCEVADVGDARTLFHLDEILAALVKQARTPAEGAERWMDVAGGCEREFTACLDGVGVVAGRPHGPPVRG